MDETFKEQIPQQNQKKLTNLVIILIISLSSLFFLIFMYYSFAVRRPSNVEKVVTFEIQEGQGVNDIAQTLFDQNLISPPFLFKLNVFINNIHKNIQAGLYDIPANTPITELAQMFQHGTTDVKITFIEGWRNEEYAIAVSDAFSGVGYEEFFIAASGLQGELFPDTYFFDREATAEEIVEILNKNYENKTENVLVEDTLNSIGLSSYDAVVFASIVEREVDVEADRAIVAGILINRWKNGLRLDADATVQYMAAINHVCNPITPVTCPTPEQAKEMDWWPKITQKDLDTPSPFNTRKQFGLPTIPISNPGISAIEAVVNYQDSNYTFYLTDEDGVTHYAETLKEHQDNIDKYL